MQKFVESNSLPHTLHSLPSPKSFNAVDKLYPQYREWILNLDSKLESPDLIFLYLIKLGYKQADIARILKKPRSTVNRQFHELEKRVGGKMEGMAS